jgi:hypothetical protein
MSLQDTICKQNWQPIDHGVTTIASCAANLVQAEFEACMADRADEEGEVLLGEGSSRFCWVERHNFDSTGKGKNDAEGANAIPLL